MSSSFNYLLSRVPLKMRYEYHYSKKFRRKENKQKGQTKGIFEKSCIYIYIMIH